MAAQPGISAISIYVPRHRVESATDNSAGAVIVKGMVDQGLRSLGLPALARDCEVSEFKQACLGGLYALKGAARWLACEGQGRTAIAVASDIAEYQRGSSGEPTQGAGAVAFALESSPRLLALDLAGSASASAYRGFDFRKPFARHFLADAGRWGAGERPRLPGPERRAGRLRHRPGGPAQRRRLPGPRRRVLPLHRVELSRPAGCPLTSRRGSGCGLFRSPRTGSRSTRRGPAR
jgi:Hydroxymethylglutaryl-coenzyme A synthase N terminal